MGVKAAGSVFWASFLVLFPVAVQPSSLRCGCVTYKHRETCGLKGSSVEFPCSYPNNVQVISISGWSKKLHHKKKSKPLKQMPAYSLQMNYPERENNDCTLKLTDLKKSDASVYYFTYSFINATGYHLTCTGVPGVRLHIFESLVSILVKKLVRGRVVPVADGTVIEGHKITLTCAPTCAENLNSNPGYIWYKNRLQLNGSRANSRFLSLDPISNEDRGSYVCAMIGYKDLPSSAVNLRVQRKPQNTVVSTEIPNGGLKKYSALTQTHGCDAQNSTDKIFNNCQTPKNESMYTFSIIIVASVCVGWVITILVAILGLKVKKKKKRRRAGSITGSPNPNRDSYMALDINSISAEYDTLDTVKRCSAADTVYENLHQPGTSMR